MFNGCPTFKCFNLLDVSLLPWCLEFCIVDPVFSRLWSLAFTFCLDPGKSGKEEDLTIMFNTLTSLDRAEQVGAQLMHKLPEAVQPPESPCALITHPAQTNRNLFLTKCRSGF